MGVMVNVFSLIASFLMYLISRNVANVESRRTLTTEHHSFLQGKQKQYIVTGLKFNNTILL